MKWPGTSELYYRPEQDKFLQAAKTAKLKKQLSKLEGMVPSDPWHPLICGSAGILSNGNCHLWQKKVSPLARLLWRPNRSLTTECPEKSEYDCQTQSSS